MDFIGIDVGTSGCKASVLSQTGKILASAVREYGFLRSEQGHAALDLPLVWQSVKDALREIAPHAGNVRAATASSLGETIVVLDQNDRILLPEGITYIDTRNIEEWNRLAGRIDPARLYALTGKGMPQIAMVNQYAWHKRNHPRAFSKAKRILFVDSFVTYMLSGEAMLDYSTASNSLLFDINQYTWSKELANAFEVDLSLFPPVGRMGSSLGKIRKSLSEELGLPQDMEILVGCHDQISATIGAGAIEAGAAVLGEGSTEALNVRVERENLLHLQKSRLPVEPFVDRGQYIVMISKLTHGTCLKWFVQTCGRDLLEKGGYSLAYDTFNALCPPSSEGLVFLPYLSRTYFSKEEPQALGVFLGLENGVSRETMYRAVLEGLSCETKSMLNQLSRHSISVERLIATGGASKSSQYMQIKSNLLRKPISVLDNAESGIRGLAMVCAVKKGCFQDLSEAAKEFSRIAQCYTPKNIPDSVENRYFTVSSAIKDLYKML